MGTALIPAAAAGVDDVPTSDPREELGETYLHLEALDLQDESAIERFVDRHGVLGVRFRDYELVAPFVRARPAARAKLAKSVEQACREAEDWYGAPMGAPGDGAWWGRGTDAAGVFVAPQAESLAEFRFGALCLRDLVMAWRVVAEGLPPRDAEWHIVRQPQTVGSPLGGILEDGLTAALVLFSPGAMFIPGAEVRDERGASGAAVTSRWTQVPLYSRLVLELFNHIAERVEYRSCKECGRRFVRQEGRAHHRQHRVRGEGPQFCSAAHASAFTTRASRRRAREARS